MNIFDVEGEGASDGPGLGGASIPSVGPANCFLHRRKDETATARLLN